MPKDTEPVGKASNADFHRTRIREDYTLIDVIEKVRSMEPR